MQVEDRQRLRIGGAAERDALLPGGMSPAAAARILLFREHAVVDDEIGTGDEADEVLRRPLLAMLDVADVADDPAVMSKAVSGGAVRMAQGQGVDAVAVAEAKRLPGLEADMLEAGRQLIEPHRKDRRRIDPLERRLGSLAAEIAAMGADQLVPDQRRLEERQAADVIEVEVAEEDVAFLRRVRAELCPQRRQAGPGIDDEEALAAAHLDARRVAAEFPECRAGSAHGAAHAPELNPEHAGRLRYSPQRHVPTVPPIQRRGCAPAHIVPASRLDCRKFLKECGTLRRRAPEFAPPRRCGGGCRRSPRPGRSAAPRRRAAYPSVATAREARR